LIGLDTNVLVRFIVRDDLPQTKAATRLIEARCTAETPGLVSSIVLCEIVWVLSRGYGYSRGEVAEVLRRILSVQELRVHRPDLAWRVMQRFEAGRADFADYLIGLSNREEKAQITFTFDAKAAQSDLFATVPLDD